MRFVFVLLFLFSSQPVLADVSQCNLAGVKHIIVERVKDAIVAAYAIGEQTVDRAAISVKPGQIFHNHETLNVRYKSPTGTPLWLTSAEWGPGRQYSLAEGLGYEFEVKKTYDADGNLVDRYCHATPGISIWIYRYDEIMITNPATNVTPSVWANFKKVIPGTDPAVTPADMFKIVEKLKR